MHRRTSRTPAQARRLKALALQRGRLGADALRPNGPAPISFTELPRISEAIAALPAEDARCLKFLMLSAGRASEVRQLRGEGLHGMTWVPHYDHMLGMPSVRPLSEAASDLAQVALRMSVGNANEGAQVFRTARDTEFSSEQILRKLRAVDPSLEARSFRVTFAHWTAVTCRRAADAQLALGHPTEEDRQVFLKFGPASFEAAMDAARKLMDEWATVCH
jgi:integrase